MMFIGFPSAKDPAFGSQPGHQNKSTCCILTEARMEWFQGTLLQAKYARVRYRRARACAVDNP